MYLSISISIFFDMELLPQEKGSEELCQRNVREHTTTSEGLRRKAGRSWKTLSGNFSFLLSEFSFPQKGHKVMQNQWLGGVLQEKRGPF